MTNQILNMANIVKTYQMGDEEQTVLKKINFSLNEGEFVAVLGPSGSGKSTLMNIIGCLDVPTSGSYILNGNEVEELNESELAQVRNMEIGFVFQQFQLLPRLTALQNVELPLIYSGIPEKERKKLATEMLTRVGLSDKLKNRPNQLSGGQQQRVAIARALVTHPTILLADEPTGALDQKTGHQIMDLFKELNREGRTIVMITHDEKIAKHGSRIVQILDGELTEELSQVSQPVASPEGSTISIQNQTNHVEAGLPVHDSNTDIKVGSIGTSQLAGVFSQMLSVFAAISNDEKMSKNAGALIKMVGEKMLERSSQNSSQSADEQGVQ